MRLPLTIAGLFMPNNVFELKAFYDSELGKFTCRELRKQISKIWDPHKDKILGLGFALPYLPIMAYNNKCTAFMPGTIGAMRVDETTAVAMVNCEMLPARQEYFDRIIIIHGIENSGDLQSGLAEMWRVLKPNGKILLVVPNQNSLWQKLKTPFKTSNPYPKSKLKDHLNHSKFAIRKFKPALFFIPTRWRSLNKITNLFGFIFLRAYCGVHIIEAEKLVYGISGGRPVKIMPGFLDKVFKPKVIRT